MPPLTMDKRYAPFVAHFLDTNDVARAGEKNGGCLISESQNGEGLNNVLWQFNKYACQVSQKR